MASRFWVGGTGVWDGTDTSHWAATSGGASGASVPTSTDDVFLDGNSGTGTISLNATSRQCLGFDCTGYAGTLSIAGSLSLSIFAGMTLSAAMTYTVSGSGSAGLRFPATTTNGGAGWPITTAGKSMGVSGSSNSFNGVGGKWKLQDSWTQVAGATLNHTAGELDTNGQAIQTGSFSSTGSTTRTLTLGTSVITLVTTTTTIVWNVGGSNLTINAASAAIVIGANSTNVRTFAGFGATYGTLTYNRSGSTGGLDITGGATFGTLNFSDASNARTLRVTAGTTVSITTAFNVFGLAGKLMTITSPTAATHTWSKASGTVTADYCSIDHSIATGGAVWNATNSTDGGSNTGWLFAAPPPDTGFFAVL